MWIDIMRRIFACALLVVWTATMIVVDPILADAVHQTVFDSIAVSSVDIVATPGIRMHSGAFGVSSNEDFVLAVSREGYFRYPSIYRDWQTTGYSVFASPVDAPEFERYDPNRNEPTTSPTAEASHVPRMSYYEPNNTVVYPSDNKRSDVLSLL